MRFYLAHPFDSRNFVRLTELIIEQNTGIELVNPFYDLDRQDTALIDAGSKERYEDLDYDTLVRRDLACIDSCHDGIVAYIPGDTFQFGTPCECWYAYKTKKKVYVISDTHAQHPWIRFVTNRSAGNTFKDFAEFEAWVQFALDYNSRRDKARA